jgi:hypothetical protein
MDRRAQLGEQLMIFMFLFFMVVIGAGIVIGAYVFIGPEFDFRPTEAAILNYQIRECFTHDTFSMKDKMEEGTFKDFVFKQCKLNAEVIGTYNGIKICNAGQGVDDCIKEGKPLFSTGGDFQPCGFNEKNKFFGCAVQSVVKNGQSYVVITISKQQIRRSQR